VIWGCFVKLRNDSLAGIGRLALEAASNEAFAPQVLGCLKLMDIPFDDSRVNPTVGP
jgi:acetyl-CoA C-acetyltransferase